MKTASVKKDLNVKNDAPAVEHKAYVKGLPWAATGDEVSEFFKACGEVFS